MTVDDDHETWLIDTGAEVIEKRVEQGDAALTDKDRLTYALWVADYGMRNAGDLDTAADVFADFQELGRASAAALGLPKSLAVFALTRDELQRRYFDLFDELCAEIRAANPAC